MAVASGDAVDSIELQEREFRDTPPTSSSAATEVTEDGFRHPQTLTSSTSSTSVLFRSERMCRCQLILQEQSAYTCILELGELGMVQFLDLNKAVSSFQRKFVHEVRRCEEMERQLRFIQREAVRDDLAVPRADLHCAPAARDLQDLESVIGRLENDLNSIQTNYTALKQSQQELVELKHVLQKSQPFLDEANNSQNAAAMAAESGELAGQLGDTGFNSDNVQLVETENVTTSMRFHITAGVLERSRVNSFERILWRVSRGNVFCRFADIAELLEDPKSGSLIEKSVFLIFHQGDALQSKVQKICEGYHATTYPCPETAEERRQMEVGVMTRLEDMDLVLGQTEEQRRRLVMKGADNLRNWFTKVRKMKAIYHCLNMFISDATHKGMMVAECWLPERDILVIQEALRRGATMSEADIVPVLNMVATDQEPPTFNRLNKVTAVFQLLISSYGVPTYREVNPTPYAIATFPFLFAVMFGDMGHGLIILLAGLWMIYKERKIETGKNVSFVEKFVAESEIARMFFGGRYIIAMMGASSIYTGLIYNDIFAKSPNIFGSKWYWRESFSFPLEMESTLTLDPGNFTQYKGDPYWVGLDPGWQDATNKIQFQNTYKMKISLIFGLTHMIFGLFLSLWNMLNKRKYIDIVFDFIPQLIFILFLFVYLIILIIFKWFRYYADTANKDTNIYSEHCAPNLLITFINMILFKQEQPKADLEAVCHGTQSYMFAGQATIQPILVVVAVLTVPIMLFGKPAYAMLGRRRRRKDYQDMEGDVLSDEADAVDSGAGKAQNEDEISFAEVLLLQSIHTIEYVLSCVSHTASYLRLWALSLAHSQLSEVLWTQLMRMALLTKGFAGAVFLFAIFTAWAVLTVSILVVMEGLSAFLHTLRLHWVEFQSKFYEGAGVAFVPFDLTLVLRAADADDKEFVKTIKMAMQRKK